jgi:hypothetical protein
MLLSIANIYHSIEILMSWLLCLGIVKTPSSLQSRNTFPVRIALIQRMPFQANLTPRVGESNNRSIPY